MRLHTLYKQPASIAYRHSCCSWAALVVVTVTTVAVIAPLWLAYAINLDLWSAQLQQFSVRHRPRVQFTLDHQLVAEFEHTNSAAIVPTLAASAQNRTAAVYNEMSGTDEGSPMVVSSSYAFLNRLTDQHQRSMAIRVIHHQTTDTHRLD